MWEHEEREREREGERVCVGLISISFSFNCWFTVKSKLHYYLFGVLIFQIHFLAFKMGTENNNTFFLLKRKGGACTAASLCTSLLIFYCRFCRFLIVIVVLILSFCLCPSFVRHARKSRTSDPIRRSCHPLSVHPENRPSTDWLC